MGTARPHALGRGLDADDPATFAIEGLKGSLIAPTSTCARCSASPNPFSGATRFSFGLRMDGPASIDVFDAAGRLAVSRDLGSLDAGRHVLDFDGRNASGRLLAPGIWFARLRTPEGASEVTKLVRVE